MREPHRSGNGRATEQRAGQGRATPPSPAAFAGQGLQLVITIIAGVYGGRWLDERWHTGPWLLVAGAFVGAGAGFYTMYRSLTAATREAAARDGGGREGGR